MSVDVGDLKPYRRASRIRINLDALNHNFCRVKALAPESKVMAVIKANAYGHGAVQVANSLQQADAFALATLGEAIELRQAGIQQPLVVLQGCTRSAELLTMAELEIQPVVHQLSQIEWLEKYIGPALAVWLKIDTGMHRLGVAVQDAVALCHRLQACAGVAEVRLMSHFANADFPDNGLNNSQMECFLNVINNFRLEASMANSAALVAIPDSRLDWVRPGIMLYGSSPLGGQSANDLGLEAVMNFESQLLAVQDLKQGDVVGYGSTWQCPEAMQIGVVGAGYADGYPRHAQSGTPVWINQQRCPLVGRVSMDSLCIDLRGVKAQVGDRVVLWGNELAVDEVAQGAATIAYEILCHAGSASDGR